MTKVTWEQLPKIIEAAASKVIEEQTNQLKADVVAAWPVATGASQRGWQIREYKSGSFALVNFVSGDNGYNYVRDLWRGLPFGSKQLPNGGDPILQRNLRELQGKLEGMVL